MLAASLLSSLRLLVILTVLVVMGQWTQLTRRFECLKHLRSLAKQTFERLNVRLAMWSDDVAACRCDISGVNRGQMSADCKRVSTSPVWPSVRLSICLCVCVRVCVLTCGTSKVADLSHAHRPHTENTQWHFSRDSIETRDGMVYRTTISK